jgi:hypothetical protein
MNYLAFRWPNDWSGRSRWFDGAMALVSQYGALVCRVARSRPAASDELVVDGVVSGALNPTVRLLSDGSPQAFIADEVQDDSFE